MSSLSTALEAAGSAGSDFGKAWVLNAMGVTYASLEHYEEATSYLEQSLALWRAVGHQRGTSMVLNNLGERYRRARLLRASGRVLRDGPSVLSR